MAAKSFYLVHHPGHTERCDFHRNASAAKLRHALGGIGDDQKVARRLSHHFLPQQCATGAFDQTEIRRDFVGAVDSQVNANSPPRHMDRYAEFLSPSRGVQRRSNGLDLQFGRSYSFGQKTQETIRRRSGAETQQHIAAYISDGGLRDGLLLFVKLFAGLGGSHDYKHILDGVRRSSEKAGENPMERRFRLRRLRRSELPAGTLQLARFLIGKTLVHDLPEGRISGRIVETEAYPPGDAAGHAFRGETPRNRSLFLKRGHAYVYFAYGLHWLLNVSSELPGVGAGTLLRALELLEGVDLAQNVNRKTARLCDLGRGPGRLAATMRIDKRCDGADLCAAGPLWLGTEAWPVKAIGKTVRIGISRDVDRRFRFYERGNPCVSGPARLLT
jgi:DNA-3-methyladenine glycosylase